MSWRPVISPEDLLAAILEPPASRASSDEGRTEILTVRVPPQLLRAVQGVVQSAGSPYTSASAFVRDAVARWLHVYSALQLSSEFGGQVALLALQRSMASTDELQAIVSSARAKIRAYRERGNEAAASRIEQQLHDTICCLKPDERAIAEHLLGEDG